MIIQCDRCGWVKLKSGGIYRQGWDKGKEVREWWGEPEEREPETGKVKKVTCPECMRKMSTGTADGRKMGDAEATLRSLRQGD